MIWTIEKRKQGNEISVSSNVKLESILVGEGYTKKEYKRSMELAQVIVNALNEYESVCEFRRKQGVELDTDDSAMEAFEKELKENDSGHQPC